MVLVVAFLLLVSLVIDAVISAGANRIFGESTAIIAHTIELTISFAVVTVLFALIFRYLPDVRIEWRDVWLGAVFTSILFIIGKFALGLYLGRSAVGSAYGAAGSLVVLLLWIYYSAQIMLFGAEFTQVYSRSHGSRAGEAKPAPFHQIEPSRAHAPSLTPQRATARKSGGGLKFAIGGVTGLFIGVLAGAIGGAIVLVKSVMKLIVAPFR
jgi:membrane protein